MKVLDKLRGYRCSPLEAKTLYYFENGPGAPRPDDEELRRIRLDPDPDLLDEVRALWAR